MNRKILVLLAVALLAGPMAAKAQTETLVYIGGDMTGTLETTQYFGDSPGAPPPYSFTSSINGIIAGSLTLSAPLPLSGTVTVDPTSVNIQGVFSPIPLDVEPFDTSFTFTTAKGAIVGWNVQYNFCPCYGQQSFTLSSSSGDSYTIATSFTPDANGYDTIYTGGASGPSGTWSIAAPEIDPTCTASGLTLLAGGLIVLRGRRQQRFDA